MIDQLTWAGFAKQSDSLANTSLGQCHETLVESSPVFVDRPKPRLTCWHIDRGRAYGKVQGHPHFPDGTWLRTSMVLGLLGDQLRTMNRVYKLDSPSDVQSTDSSHHRWR